ncbi:MAG TPA: type II toxin-antitoxin system VapC family toxin [bacterium]|nr:type II toxin-antitoxin system VapC family toxin [bacterium]
MKYLIDTDWVIDHFAGVEKITKKLEELAPQGIGLSVISLAELYEGIYFSNSPYENEKVLERFLEIVSILGINKEICKIFGRERGRLRRKGILISDFDLLIASTCLYYDLTLLTNNVRHFERVENLKILTSGE